MDTVERVDVLTSIERRVESLPEAAPTCDDLCALYDSIEGYQSRLKQMKDALDEYCIANGFPGGAKELRIGDVRRYIAPVKKTKVRDLRQAIEAVFLAVGGEFDAFVNTLSVNALKPGESKKVLGDQFEAVFEVTEEMDLKTERPRLAVHKTNDRFAK